MTLCTNLRSLTLGFQLPALAPFSGHVWSSVLGTLSLLDGLSTIPPFQELSFDVAFSGLATFDTRAMIVELGMPSVEPLLLHLCQRANLNGIVFRSPPYSSKLFFATYRASIAICFPELRKRRLLLYQERLFQEMGEVEVL